MLIQHDAHAIESLPGIRVPALVIVVADDKAFLAAADYKAAKIPATRLVVIPAAGHAVNIDQPQAFLDAVLPFFNGLESRKKQKAVL
jgi:pimeloyl-ACP methyl ester carboxylesterase